MKKMRIITENRKDDELGTWHIQILVRRRKKHIRIHTYFKIDLLDKPRHNHMHLDENTVKLIKKIAKEFCRNEGKNDRERQLISNNEGKPRQK